MKKNFIQACGTIGLAIFMGTVSAQAQNNMTCYTANIPCDFDFGQKTYKAEVYRADVARDSDGAMTTMRDNRRQELY